MKTNMITNPSSRHLLCAGMALGACAFAQANAAVIVNFNDTAQLGNNFNQGSILPSGGGSLINSVSGGLGGTGSLALPTGADSFLYSTKSAISSTSGPINVSIYFQAQAATLTGGALSLSIGLVDNTTTLTSTSPTSAVSVPDASTSNSFTFTLRTAGSAVGSGLTYNLVSYNNAAVTSAATSNVPATVNLTAGNWYQLAAAYTYAGSNNFSLTGQIFNSSSTGVLGSALFTTAPVWNVTNAGLADGDVYGLLGSQNGNRRGVARLDNYSLVPEPSSVLLLGAGMGLIALRRSRNSIV